MEKSTFKFSDFPSDPFELRGKLFAFGLEERVNRSIEFLNGEFSEKDKVYLCCDFMDHIFLDTFKGDARELDKHGGFPGIETHYQFDFAIKHALSGSYRAAFDNLRSCLELTVLSIFFSYEKHIFDNEDVWNMSSEEFSDALKDEKKWFNSLENTPHFSRMIKQIMKEERFMSFNSYFSISQKLLQLYYTLSDYTHVKGYKMGIQNMNSVRSHYNHSFFQSINTASLKVFFEILIELIENLTLILSLYNPIILVELPLEEKFGVNGPIGFIHPAQTEIIWKILPEIYKSGFKDLLIKDEEVLSLVHWIDSRPSLNLEDMKRQFDDFNSIFSKSTD